MEIGIKDYQSQLDLIKGLTKSEKELAKKIIPLLNNRGLEETQKVFKGVIEFIQYDGLIKVV